MHGYHRSHWSDIWYQKQPPYTGGQTENASRPTGVEAMAADWRLKLFTTFFEYEIQEILHKSYSFIFKSTIAFTFLTNNDENNNVFWVFQYYAQFFSNGELSFRFNQITNKWRSDFSCFVLFFCGWTITDEIQSGFLAMKSPHLWSPCKHRAIFDFHPSTK